MKFLIVGLGNIGDEYVHTRHNIGFDVVDRLAQELKVTFTLERHAWVAEAKWKGKTLILVKPTTYMNLSGKAVSYWMQQTKCNLEHVLIVCDDLALPLGKIRIRLKGSSGGQNGLKHIQETLGTDAYIRMRCGIGNAFEQGRQVDYVLGKFTSEEEKLMIPTLEKADKAIFMYCSQGIEMAMNLFNG